MERRKKFEEAYKSASLDRGKQKHIIGGPDFEVFIDIYRIEFLHVCTDHDCWFNNMGTFLQEGPNSQMKEEEFYDAVDAGLDRLDEKFDEMMVWMPTDLFIYSVFCRINAQRTL